MIRLPEVDMERDLPLMEGVRDTGIFGPNEYGE